MAAMRALVLLLAFAPLAAPGASADRGGFYLRGQEGWFWYQREPEPPPESEAAPPPAPAPPQLSGPGKSVTIASRWENPRIAVSHEKSRN